jgi:hypothetical protein
MLVSSVQHEKGARHFYPTFGFAYKAKNTKFLVTIHENGNSHEIMNQLVDDKDGVWNYFSKNLTDVTVLKDAWSSGSALDWKVTNDLD